VSAADGRRLLYWDDEVDGATPLIHALGVSLGKRRGQPRDHVRRGVPAVDRLMLIDVLQLRSATNPSGGAVLASHASWAICRMCGRPLGTRDFFGHGFVWPEGAAHYVVAHQVWTPECDEMLAAIRRERRTT